jgi:hypothetical protein
MPNLSNTSSINALAILQKNFCLVKLSGEIRIAELHEVNSILIGQKEGEISFCKRPDGEFLMTRFLESLSISCDAKKTISDFRISSQTHLYDAIAFSPKLTPITTLNYWVGPLVQPLLGQWDLIKEYLFEVICNTNMRTYKYLIQYLAHMVQKPEDKPGVMIILLGGQGTGKGMFFQLLKKIWPRTTLLVSDINQIVGQFNAALERNYVICMDEAMFSGDRKSQDRLKSLITEKTCHIEQKYQPSRTIDSFHRFFASSNHEHFSRIEGDDRRSVFIRVSDKHQNDHTYFSKLHVSFNDEAVMGALLNDLMKMDLNGFNVRDKHITKEHDKQKMKSLVGFERYFYEVLINGMFMQDHYYSAPRFDKVWNDGDFISSTELIEGFKAFDKNSQRYQTLQTQEVAETLKRICPSMSKRRTSLANQGQKRGFVLPNLDVARAEFEKAYSVSIDWNSPDGSQDV